MCQCFALQVHAAAEPIDMTAPSISSHPSSAAAGSQNSMPSKHGVSNPGAPLHGDSSSSTEGSGSNEEGGDVSRHNEVLHLPAASLASSGLPPLLVLTVAHHLVLPYHSPVSGPM